MAKKTQLKVKVPNRDTSSSEGCFVVDSNYHWTHDKVRMYIVKSKGYNYTGLGYFSFNMEGELQYSQTWTFEEIFESKWIQRWLKKNNCGIYILPKYENMVEYKWMHVTRSRFKPGVDFIRLLNSNCNIGESRKVVDG